MLLPGGWRELMFAAKRAGRGFAAVDFRRPRQCSTFERLVGRLGSLNQQNMAGQKPEKETILESIDELVSFIEHN